MNVHIIVHTVWTMTIRCERRVGHASTVMASPFHGQGSCVPSCHRRARGRSLLQFWRNLEVARVGSFVFCSTSVLPVEEVCVEAHLSAQQSATRQEARLSRPNEYQRWPSRLESSACQGPAPSVSLIGRCSGRASFERLARTGSRARAGVLWCTFVLDPLASSPMVAYAIGRAVGPAVTRNRVRRRLRALVQSKCTDLPAGLYLVGVTPAGAQRSFGELSFDLDRLVSTIMSRARTSTAS